MTISFHPYMDIPLVGLNADLSHLELGEEIAVFEKIDGANGGFELSLDSTLRVFSRKFVLSEERNMRGFYQWVQEHIDPYKLRRGFTYYGEWLVPHSLEYPPERYNRFYLFDIYDHQKDCYLPPETVVNEAIRLGIDLDPILYYGPYLGMDHLNSILGKSQLGEEGEGLIIKVRRTCEYFKMVIPRLFEKHEIREESKTSPVKFIEDVVPYTRVVKFVHKFVDWGYLPEDYTANDWLKIYSLLCQHLLEDIFKEDVNLIPPAFTEKEIYLALEQVIVPFVDRVIENKNRSQTRRV